MQRALRALRTCARALPALAAIAGPAGGAERHMPHGSFLRTPARSAADLKRAVHTDPVVNARYRKRFNVSSSKQLDALFSGLRVVRMPADRLMRVYYTRPGGRQGFKVRRVRRGTLVFSSPARGPMLIQVCGNPITTDPRIEGMKPDQAAHHLAPDFDPAEQILEPDLWDTLLAQSRPDVLLGLDQPDPASILPQGFPIAFVALMPPAQDPLDTWIPGKPYAPNPSTGDTTSPGSQPVPPGGDDNPPAPPGPPGPPENPPIPPAPPVPPDDRPVPPAPPAPPDDRPAPPTPPYNPPGPPDSPPVPPVPPAPPPGPDIPPKPPTPPVPPVIPVPTPEPAVAGFALAALIAAGWVARQGKRART